MALSTLSASYFCKYLWNDSSHKSLYFCCEKPSASAGSVCLSMPLKLIPGIGTVICLYRFWRVTLSFEWVGLGTWSSIIPRKGSMRWYKNFNLDGPLVPGLWWFFHGKKCKNLIFCLSRQVVLYIAFVGNLIKRSFWLFLFQSGSPGFHGRETCPFPMLNMCGGCTKANLEYLETAYDQQFFWPNDDFQKLDQPSKL